MTTQFRMYVNAFAIAHTSALGTFCYKIIIFVAHNTKEWSF
jgi:hypothetical protein